MGVRCQKQPGYDPSDGPETAGLDSSAIQEETTYLGVPCLAVRETTERSATTTFGTSVRVGRDTDALKRAARHVLVGRGKRGSVPPLWDGNAAERVATHLLSECRA
jgi:UDP-N-acetylglucosamine 2-epimerase (non-hydrolysing)